MTWPISILASLLALFTVLSNRNVQVAETRKQHLSDLEAWDASVCGLNKTRDLGEAKFDIRTYDSRSEAADQRGTRLARPGEFPWVATIQVKFEEKTIECAGTLIHRNLVISAAKCFNNKERGRALDIWVSAGSNGRPPESDPRRQTIKSAKVCFSKDYDPDRRDKYDEFGYNLAVLRLEKEFECSDAINSVCLYLPRQEKQFRSLNCQLIAHEIISDDESEAHESRLLVSPMKKCSRRERELESRRYQDEVCYQADTETSNMACAGSIGSGLFCRHEGSKFRVLTGILSSTPECENGVLQPALFTDLYKLRESFDEILTNCLDLADDLDF